MKNFSGRKRSGHWNRFIQKREECIHVVFLPCVIRHACTLHRELVFPVVRQGLIPTGDTKLVLRDSIRCACNFLDGILGRLSFRVAVRKVTDISTSQPRLKRKLTLCAGSDGFFDQRCQPLKVGLLGKGGLRILIAVLFKYRLVPTSDKRIPNILQGLIGNPILVKSRGVNTAVIFQLLYCLTHHPCFVHQDDVRGFKPGKTLVPTIEALDSCGQCSDVGNLVFRCMGRDICTKFKMVQCSNIHAFALGEFHNGFRAIKTLLMGCDNFRYRIGRVVQLKHFTFSGILDITPGVGEKAFQKISIHIQLLSDAGQLLIENHGRGEVNRNHGVLLSDVSFTVQNCHLL